MISIGGKDYKTLSDPIFVNGKRIKEVYVNDKKVYPESYEFPNYDGSNYHCNTSRNPGSHVKLRGHNEITIPVVHYGRIIHKIYVSYSNMDGIRTSVLATEYENETTIFLHATMDVVLSFVSLKENTYKVYDFISKCVPVYTVTSDVPGSIYGDARRVEKEPTLEYVSEERVFIEEIGRDKLYVNCPDGKIIKLGNIHVYNDNYSTVKKIRNINSQYIETITSGVYKIHIDNV